jgi:hypothetical protein
MPPWFAAAFWLRPENLAYKTNTIFEGVLRHASRQKRAAHVPVGSSAPFRSRRRVRPVCPNQRTLSQAVETQSRAISCREQMQQVARYSMTSSARRSSDVGMSRPSALAVLRLMTDLNWVACSTGIPLGLAPLRILSTKAAARRNMTAKFTP